VRAIDGKTDVVDFRGPPQGVTKLLDLLRRDGREIRHYRLTTLEALLLRALYEQMRFNGETAEEMVRALAGEGCEAGDCKLIKQLLEEEQADRQ
jgi:hypothetical protein